MIVNEDTAPAEMVADICAVTAGCKVFVDNTTVRDCMHQTDVVLTPGNLTLVTPLPPTVTQEPVPPIMKPVPSGLTSHLMLKSDAMHRLPVRAMLFTWIEVLGPLHEVN
jgi:hypothetical protein